MGAKNKKIERLFLVIILLAIFLRVFNVKNTLLFHFDQGYHGLAIREIWDNKVIKLLGHKTDVEGIYHGSLFYYAMLPLYLLSSWDPVGVSTILALIDGISVIFIYFAARKLFNKRVGLFSSLIYAVSYSAISYSKWLSNVTLIPFFSSVLLFFLARSEGKRQQDFLWAIFFGGLIAQFNGAIGFFFIPLLLAYAFYFRDNLFAKKWNFPSYIIAYIIPQIPLILFDLRHNFLVTGSIYKHFLKDGSLSVSGAGLFGNLKLLSQEILNIFSYRIWILGLVILIWTIYLVWQDWKNDTKPINSIKLLSGGILLMFILLLYYQGINGFFMVGLIPFLSVLVGWVIDSLFNKKETKFLGLFIIASIVAVNIYHYKGFLRPGFNLVPIGTSNLITLQDRKGAIDYMYKEAEGESFQTEIYIIPYHQEQPWDYLLKSYALERYNYLPSGDGEKVFLIYEPDYDYDYRLKSWLEEKTEKYGKPESIYKSHSLTVEEREK